MTTPPFPDPADASPHRLPPPTANASPLQRWARLAQRHPWATLACWVAVLAGLVVAGHGVGGSYSNGNDVSLPGTQSQQLAEILEELGPEHAGDSVRVLLHDERGWDRALDVDALTADLAAVDRVEAVQPPDPARGTVSPDRTLGIVEVTLEGQQGGAPAETYQELVDAATAYAGDGLQVELDGKGIRRLERGEGGAAEAAGLVAALVILVLMFGSLLAASLPLVTAAVAVGSTLALVTVLSHVIEIPDFTSSLLVLVGLGVGIDYALIVFARFRSELLAGRDRESAIGRALDTAGRSVLFAGASVIVSLLGMFALGIDAYEGMVTAVSLTVVVTMVASLTLLPALLRLMAPRIERRIRRHAAGATRDPGDRWRRWASIVQRSPWVAMAVAAAALAALAVPALDLHLGFNDAGNDPEGSTSRTAYDLVAREFGPGANGPLTVIIQGSSARAQDAHDVVASHPGIAPGRVSPPAEVADDTFVIRAEPITGPQEEATAHLVEELRDAVGSDTLVGGPTAANVDFAATMSDRLPLFVVVVVGVSGLLLMTVFRSVLIPIKAVILNLLSIGAALGAMKLVFQDGRFGAEAGPIEAYLPVFVFAIVFGLSMDYEVFLLSRAREVWAATGDARDAIREGLAHTGGVITAAAAIMCVVFGSFVLMPDRMLQQAGFAMAVAVLLDAVVVRCLLVPAAMHLLGARAWWLPPAAARLLPHIRVEGAPDTARQLQPVDRDTVRMGHGAHGDR